MIKILTQTTTANIENNPDNILELETEVGEEIRKVEIYHYQA